MLKESIFSDRHKVSEDMETLVDEACFRGSEVDAKDALDDVAEDTVVFFEQVVRRFPLAFTE